MVGGEAISSSEMALPGPSPGQLWHDKTYHNLGQLNPPALRSGSSEADCSACQFEPSTSKAYWGPPPAPHSSASSSALAHQPAPSTTSTTDSSVYNFQTQPCRPPSALANPFTCSLEPPAADCCAGMSPELCCDESTCADDPHALPLHPGGTTAASGAALAAAGRWWDAVLDGCEACANQDYSVDPSDCAACGSSQACPNPRALAASASASVSGSSSRVPTPWPGQTAAAGEPCCPDWVGLLEECSDGCFDVGGSSWPMGGGEVADDCPDCWQPSGAATPASAPSLSRSHLQLTPASTPCGSAGSPTAGLTELMKGLDQRTVQEILECCYCAPSASLDPSWSPSAHFNHTACPTGPHEHPAAAFPASTAHPSPFSVAHSMPVQQVAFDSNGQFADQTFAALVSQFPATQLGAGALPGAFACRWGGCSMSFVEHGLLVRHVTSAHLGVCETVSSTGVSGTVTSGFGLTEPIQPWEDLASLAGTAGQPSISGTTTPVLIGADASSVLPGAVTGPSVLPHPIPLPAPAATAPAPGPGSEPDPLTVQQATSTLLKHLIDDHLAKLEPGLAQALGKELQASAEAAARLAAVGVREGRNGKEGQQERAGAGEVEVDAVSTGSGHTHSTEEAAAPAAHEHHAHSHSHVHSHTHKHPHGHPHHGPHRHAPTRHQHAHPYGVAPRASASNSTTSAPTASTTPATPTPTPDGAHPCKWKDCGLRFASSALLMSHLSLAHVGSGKAGYTCEWEGCDRAGGGDGKGFAQRQKVMRHLQTHTGDRPFVCSVCHKSFSEAMTLTQHMRVHTNERPYACTHPGCDKAFALASALTIHLRTHSGDKPFKCPHPGCGSAFAESSNLSKHVRTHGGEKGYGCGECGKRFARSDQLARHRRIHERGKGVGEKVEVEAEGREAGMEGVTEG